MDWGWWEEWKRLGTGESGRSLIWRTRNWLRKGWRHRRTVINKKTNKVNLKLTFYDRFILKFKFILSFVNVDLQIQKLLTLTIFGLYKWFLPISKPILQIKDYGWTEAVIKVWAVEEPEEGCVFFTAGDLVLMAVKWSCLPPAPHHVCVMSCKHSALHSVARYNYSHGAPRLLSHVAFVPVNPIPPPSIFPFLSFQGALTSERCRPVGYSDHKGTFRCWNKPEEQAENKILFLIKGEFLEINFHHRRQIFGRMDKIADVTINDKSINRTID